MRFLIKFNFPNEAANAAMKAGTFGDTIASLLDELKPEAVYFGGWDGTRTAFVVTHIEEASQIPAMFEPWFLAFNVTFEWTPVMLPEDLEKAGPAIGQAVEKYG